MTDILIGMATKYRHSSYSENGQMFCFLILTTAMQDIKVVITVGYEN